MSMDAVKFLAERQRMCETYDVCEGCALHKMHTGLCYKLCFKHPEEAVAAVEKWAEEHPRKTRQSEFLKQWPEVVIDEKGNVGICPANISQSHRDRNGWCAAIGRECESCRREFWMQEVE